MAKIALYLAGGGARGAYQAGVLKAIHHILKTKTLPFDMISGVSVGSINAAVLADHADDFQAAIEKLESLWSDIHCQQIFDATNYALIKSVTRNISALFIKQQKTGHLLDTAPLYQFIQDNIDFEHIQSNIEKGHLETFEILTSCYEKQQTISFYDHHQNGFEDWSYPRHISQHMHIKAEHILASSALPLFFPPVYIQNAHFGDGSVGLISPLRGAIRFQMNKILILGTRHLPTFSTPETLVSSEIGFAHVLGNMLNGLFLDNLDHDIEMVNRMNEIAVLLSIWKKRYSPWRPINTLYLRPSRDLGDMAQDLYQSMPSLLRFLLNVLGTKGHSGDLLSFLLFEKKYTRELLALGYKDTMAISNEMKEFFS